MVVKRRSFAQARKAAGYTQEGLAERLGVDRTTVARWEAGEYEPHPWQRPRIAEAFGLSLCEFISYLVTSERQGARSRYRHRQSWRRYCQMMPVRFSMSWR